MTSDVIATIQLVTLRAQDADEGAPAIIDVPKGTRSVALWIVTTEPTLHPQLCVSLWHVAPQDDTQRILAATATPLAGVKRLVLTSDAAGPIGPKLQLTWALSGGAVDVSIAAVFYGTAQQQPRTLTGLLCEWAKVWAIPVAFGAALLINQ